MFEGFDDQTVEFLWGIRFNNEKPWFEAHKQLYLDHVFTPMRDLPGFPDLPGRPPAPWPGTLQRPPVVFRGAAPGDLDAVAVLLV